MDAPFKINIDFLNEKAFIDCSLDSYIKWEAEAKQTQNNNITSIKIENIKNIRIHEDDKLDIIIMKLAQIKLIIEIDSELFIARLNAQIAHQLGSRIWRKKILTIEGRKSTKYLDLYSNEYSNSDEISLDEIYVLLIRLVRNDKCDEILVRYIKDIFRKNNLVIIYFKSKVMNASHEIYGIVSSIYNALNQNEFRNVFLEECAKNKLSLNLESSKQLEHKKFKSIYEFIKTDHVFINDNIDISLVIEYGKNNGYRSYRFHWLISVINSNDDICIIKSKYNWKNNPLYIAQGFNYSKFIHEITIEGKTIVDGINKKINKIKESSLTSDDLNIDLFLDKIKVARATKERITDLWEKNNENESLWDFIKCLSHFANNSQSTTSNNMLNLIKRSSIEILEYGENVLKKWGEEGSRFIVKN